MKEQIIYLRKSIKILIIIIILLMGMLLGAGLNSAVIKLNGFMPVKYSYFWYNHYETIQTGEIVPLKDVKLSFFADNIHLFGTNFSIGDFIIMICLFSIYAFGIPLIKLYNNLKNV